MDFISDFWTPGPADRKKVPHADLHPSAKTITECPRYEGESSLPPSSDRDWVLHCETSATKSRLGLHQTGRTKKVGTPCILSHLTLPTSSSPPSTPPLPFFPHTMSFVANAVAGPSRVRSARTALNVAVCVRHQSSNTRAPRGYEPRELTQEDLDRKEYDDAVAAYHQKLNRSAREPAEREANYEAWLKTVGARYLQHRPGTKATWLGESVVSIPMHTRSFMVFAKADLFHSRSLPTRHSSRPRPSRTLL